jgi:peptidoglycan hydrolase CwlO-like protein
MKALFENPALVGLIIALPSLLLGYLGYRSSVKKDAVAQTVNVASAEHRTIEQVIDAQTDLIGSLQNDNRDLRSEIRALNRKLDALKKQIDGLPARLSNES